jgi:hypothetical protein
MMAKGANQSMIHVDLMIGSHDVDIDGIAGSGASAPLMRGGDWGVKDPASGCHLLSQRHITPVLHIGELVHRDSRVPPSGL